MTARVDVAEGRRLTANLVPVEADCPGTARGKPARLLYKSRTIAGFPERITPGGAFVHCMDCRAVAWLVNNADALLAAAEERDALREALSWFDFVEDVEAPGWIPDEKPVTVEVTRIAAGWRRAQDLYAAALAAAGETP